MGTHADLYKRHKAVLPDWAPVYYEQPISIVDGDGRHVTDAEGNEYLDFFGGILVTMSGYNVPEVVEAINATGEPDSVLSCADAATAWAPLLDHLLEEYPEEMAGLFFGLVVASIVIAWRLLETRDARRIGVLIGTAAVTFWVLGFQSGPVSDPALLAFFGKEL